MSSERSAKQLDARLKIAMVSTEDQVVRIQGFIARDAFLETTGSSFGHELENWQHAKFELVKPLCCGLMVRGEDILVDTDLGEFEEGTVEMWVSRDRVTIGGEPRKARGIAGASGSGPREENRPVFRTLNLPVEIEPSAVTAELNGPVLEICFPKAHAEACS